MDGNRVDKVLISQLAEEGSDSIGENQVSEI
jgi:hypothetical protein